MDNKKTIIIGVIITIAIIVVALLIITINKKEYYEEFSKEDKKILVEKSYSNGAWGFVYEGEVIFNDGTIYKFSYKNYKDYVYDDLSIQTNWILENGTKDSNKVTKKEIKEIEKNMKSLEDKITEENTSIDAGSNFIVVWNYDNNTKITLKKEGDFTGENETDPSKKIQKIIKDYI